MSRVTAVIVHWGDPAETVACARGVAAEPEVECLVVDNGSPDPVAGLLAEAVPEARCLRLPENRGYAGGGNAGIRTALAGDAEVVLLLNNDARLVPGACRAASVALARDPRIAVVGAKVRTREDPRRLWLAWGEVTYRQSLVALSGADAPDGPAWSERRDVDWVAGCAMWMRRQALEEIGLLDEEFFAYHEEVEWCTRARRAGWRVVYEPAAVVTHTGQGSSGSPASIRIRKYFAARNAILFARRHASRSERARLAGCMAAGLLAELLWHTARGTAEGTRWKLRGVRDALGGRRPPFEALGLR